MTERPDKTLFETDNTENSVPAEDLISETENDGAFDGTGSEELFSEAETDTAFDDAEDIFSETRKKAPAPNKGLVIAIIAMAVLAVLLIAAAGVLYALKQKQESDRTAAEVLAREAAEELERNRIELSVEQSAEYTSIVERNVMLEGITIENVPVGGMTLEQARAAVTTALNIKPAEGSLDLVLNETHYPFALSCFLTETDLDAVLAQANSVLRSGSQDSVLAEAEDIRTNGRNFPVTFSTDDSGVEAAVNTLADSIDIPVENAAIGTIDTEKHEVTFAPGTDGLAVDRAELATRIRFAFVEDMNTPVEIPYTVVPATGDVTEPIFTIMETSLKGSSSNRIFNVTKGADMINGTVLKPGQVFSANDTLGIRTTKNGWKMAHAYVGGTTEEQAGGGVCQLSSTLYNAAVMADLEIVFRRNHSMFVSYVSRGLDATINSVGNMIDFKMRNNTDSDVIIFSWVSGKTLTMKVYRCPFGTDEWDEIRLSSEKVRTIQPSGDWEITVDETKGPGYEEILQDRRNGELWQSYKTYYKNGTKVKTEKLDSSTYSAFAGKKIVGPEPLTTPTASPTVSPANTPTLPPAPPTSAPTSAPTAVPTSAPTPVPENTPAPEPPAEKPAEGGSEGGE